jgi:hypothetical protein
MDTSITITDLDAVTLQLLKQEARRRSVDVNTLAREVLRHGVPPPEGQGASHATTLHHDLDDLAGTWSEADAWAFEAAVEGFGRIDRKLWK